MSKGSWRRPTIVDKEEFARRWDAIFGDDNEQEGVEQERQEPSGPGPVGTIPETPPAEDPDAKASGEDEETA